MKIKVRIVGVYFRAEVDVAEGSSVWDATKAAESQSGGKLRIDGTYTLEKAEYDTNPSVEDSPSGVDRRSGTYSLSEDKTVRSRALVWQYYINRKTGNLGGPNNTIELRETISADNKAVPSISANDLKDGDEILWRLLAIGLDPIGPCSPAPKGKIA